ncbi:MAG: YkgJ family cysteine cluster protein [Nitrospira sp.]|nr:YkgJ family cysteine cluster protein [Nitrospira sp.]
MPEAPRFPSGSLFRKTAQWFERANALLLDSLPCRQGCFSCCIGVFPVTILDRQEIQRGLASCASKDRNRMQDKAREQVNQLGVVEPRLVTSPFVDHWSDGEMDRLTTRFDSLPCPALEPDGRCGLYEFRPLVCRSMGIPFDDGVTVTGACAVQTSVPLIQLSKSLRDEEDVLARIEAQQLTNLRMTLDAQGEELLLPYAFVSEIFIGSGGDAN